MKDIDKEVANRLHAHAMLFEAFGSKFNKFLKLSFFGSIKNFMGTLTQRLTTADYTDRFFNERQLGKVLTGGDARRYAMVNRALKDGSLLRLKRGLYALSPPYRSETIHPFAVSQALVPGSYISFEAALAYHGWIPEAVFTTSGVTPERKSLSYDCGPLGQYSFHPIAIETFQFLTGVQRKVFGKCTGFVATPLRALLDLVALRKLQWTGLDWLTQGMRIDETLLLTLDPSKFSELRQVYKHKTVRAYIAELERAVQNLKSAEAAPND